MPKLRKPVDIGIERDLPRAEIGWLKDAGFSTLRVPVEYGGVGITLPELFALLIELSEADPNITNAYRSHLGFTEDLLNAPTLPGATLGCVGSARMS